MSLDSSTIAMCSFVYGESIDPTVRSYLRGYNDEFAAMEAGEHTVVDLGAGDGRNTIPLAQRGYHVVPIESDAEAYHRLSDNLAICSSLLTGRVSIGDSPRTIEGVDLKELEPNHVIAVRSLQFLSRAARRAILQDSAAATLEGGINVFTIPSKPEHVDGYLDDFRGIFEVHDDWVTLAEEVTTIPWTEGEEVQHVAFVAERVSAKS